MTLKAKKMDEGMPKCERYVNKDFAREMLKLLKEIVTKNKLHYAFEMELKKISDSSISVVNPLPLKV